ncbi:MAG: M48 family metallopeptidase [Candidatus Polarisedimenticolaceae bacterium]|nr:M48 family metallopeptidase [Candidatus Polarisedimenticolaceae bacterium]
MKYSNPEIPEGINTSTQHPLKEFALLVGGVLGAVLAVVMVLTLLADRLAVYIPFEVEMRLASRVTEGLPVEEVKSLPIEAYLNRLADKIVAEQKLPPGMQITVHYVDDDLVNAFATLGGHLFMFRGLLEKLPHENAVAMVLAHEIAHIKHRHPIRSMGRGMIFGLAIGMVSSTLGNAMTDRVLANTGGLTVLKFSRDQEWEADQTALHALYQLYGHVDGADRLFKVLEQATENGSLQTPEFFSTHPLSKRRIDNIHAFQVGHPATADATVVALPEQFSTWLIPAAGGQAEGMP